MITVLDALKSIAQGVPVDDAELPPPRVKIIDLFTENEIMRAKTIIANMTGSGRVVDAIRRRVTRPALDRINAATGQENDAQYLAYAILHMLSVS